MKPKITIALLLLCLLFLCAFYFAAKPLITNQYSDKPIELLKNFSRTETGQKIVKHYLEQIELRAKYRIGGYDKLNSQEPEKIYFELTRLISIGFAIAIVSVISLILIVISCIETKKSLLPVPQKYTIFVLLLIVLNGTIIRLIMAWAYYGNFDMQSLDGIANIVINKGNVYALTSRYNYSPIWFTILGFLKQVQIQLPSLPFHFVVRTFLCLVDLVTLVFLLLIAHHKKISLPKIAILFYLSPVSFLLTGYHGQIENLAILMVVIGLFAYLKLSQKPIWGTAILWLFATAGMVIKHSIFYELIICLNAAIKRYQIKFLLFLISVCFFLALFIPYWNSGKEGIIKNVFMYSSHSGYYGIVSLFKFPQLKYLFIIGLFVFPLFLRNRDIIQQCLLGFLFFLTFTTGIGIQYFVLPIAIGSLRSSKGFLFYSLAASLLILGNNNNVFVPGVNISWNAVWIIVTYWFFSELMRSKQIKATEEAIQKSPKRKNLKG
jgi:hypothetical protein